MQEYDHKKIERAWQEKWKKNNLYRTTEDPSKPKAYVLDMFPYPSGEGLHVGHPKGYIATDIYSRFKKMTGHNVLHPMGWDAFGLPAENYALKNKVHPRIAVEKNIARFKEQLLKLGFNYDWEREINTTDPAYYKWTQWIFLQLFKKGLAYESDEPINWCPSCKTGLALEDLEGGRCERCGSEVEQKPIRQWVLKIREYADRLLEDLEGLEWPEHIKELQRNWIGKSEGAEIEFGIAGRDEKIKVFTTRPDTLFGATYMVLAPEHKLVTKLLNEKGQESGVKNQEEVKKYIHGTAHKTEIERMAEGKEKTGVELKGLTAINPATGEEIQIWVADYVLARYGTGAIMAVPAHDERDWEFAEKYGMEKRHVIRPASEKPSIKKPQPGAYEGDGILVNSGRFDGLSSEEAKDKITDFVGGEKRVDYKLRDWVFSRQRYWGEPIPVIHCKKCGAVPVPEEDLPVLLPDVKRYEPTGTGESPLANISEWVNVKCPKCGGEGKRETNTMPQWAGSSWYYLRYIDPANDEALVDKKKEKYWSPVDLYEGGVEHATRHLIYARFWHKFLYDIGAVNYKEPFMRLKGVGLIYGEDGRKMSKRWGNVVNPDDVVATYGADTLRVYEMFMGPFEESGTWSTESIIGSRRFLEKVWRLRKKVNDAPRAASDQKHTMALNRTVKKVTEDIEHFHFNTAVSALMIFANGLESAPDVSRRDFETLLLLLAPFAPHIAEELWRSLGYEHSIHEAPWPRYDEALLHEGVVTVVIQVNGRVRDQFEAAASASDTDLENAALERPAIQKWVHGKDIVRVVVVPHALVNIVLRG
ncbi:MAG: leucine--tRNA ligase [Parcubacteria group bacterium]|nr:leucine--tRNA ligase [Parcubacteria group bacterium]